MGRVFKKCGRRSPSDASVPSERSCKSMIWGGITISVGDNPWAMLCPSATGVEKLWLYGQALECACCGWTGWNNRLVN
jgi:hypothetical protein